MGLVGGQRATTPLTIVAVAAARGELPADDHVPRILAHPIAAGGGARGRRDGGRQAETAPDRIAAVGLAALHHPSRGRAGLAVRLMEDRVLLYDTMRR